MNICQMMIPRRKYNAYMGKMSIKKNLGSRKAPVKWYFKGLSQLEQCWAILEGVAPQEPPKRGQRAFSDSRHSGAFSAIEEVTHMSCVPNFVLDNGEGKNYSYSL